MTRTTTEPPIRWLPGGRIIDVSGQRFGRLTAIRHVGRGQWECLCDCGTTCTRHGGRMRCGGVRSCGCLGAEIQARWVETRRQRFINQLRAEGWTIEPPAFNPLEMLAGRATL